MKRLGLQWLLLGLFAVWSAGAVPGGVLGGGPASAFAQFAPPGGSDSAESLALHAELLGVSPAKLTQLRDDCRAAGFTSEEFARLLALVTRAKLTGLPHQQLLSKLDEGLAKEALPERTLRALEVRARYLRDAKEEVVDPLIVQGWRARDYPLAVGLVADALGAGASAAELVNSVRRNESCASRVPDVRTAFIAPRR